MWKVFRLLANPPRSMAPAGLRGLLTRTACYVHPQHLTPPGGELGAQTLGSLANRVVPGFWGRVGNLEHGLVILPGDSRAWTP